LQVLHARVTTAARMSFKRSTSGRRQSKTSSYYGHAPSSSHSTKSSPFLQLPPGDRLQSQEPHVRHLTPTSGQQEADAHVISIPTTKQGGQPLLFFPRSKERRKDKCISSHVQHQLISTDHATTSLLGEPRFLNTSPCIAARQ
jgi:hypothetical protein